MDGGKKCKERQDWGWRIEMELFEYIQKINKEFGLIKTLEPLGFDFHEKSKIRECEKVRKEEVTIIPKRRNSAKTPF